MPVSMDGCEEPGLSSVRDKPCACVLWGPEWGAPKNKKGGVQGISNPSVPPQDRELRPEEIEGKGFPERTRVSGGVGLGVHTGEGLSSLPEELEARKRLQGTHETGDKVEHGGGG